MEQIIDYQVAIDKEVGNRLSAFISATGKTKAEIARLAKIDPATISRIISSSQPMGPKVIIGLTNSFDVNPQWLLTGEGKMGSALQKNLLEVKEEAATYLTKHQYKDRKALRLIELRQALDLSQEEMALRLEIDAADYELAELGKTPFTQVFSALIVKTFNLFRPWWETGQGDMFQPTDIVELEMPEVGEFKAVLLPICPINIEGGFGEMSDPEANYGNLQRMKALVPASENVERNILFSVRGNSMYPKYSEGTIVRCKRVPRGDWEYLSPAVYAFSYGSSLVLKRIKDNDLLTKGYLVLHSDNPDYGGSYPLPIEHIHHIWKILSINFSPPD